ncbi:helix-turn-helix domain-containing protein [Streptomyces malaysiensis]|uniref:Helix-turn-helix domain-containing protein n=1 Tax=Streptomyces malaysiensis subsp. samsunensis TaxID=459658 RepID=A0A9X2LYU5_STRMQ|nr:helix-turn-helix domain-containing protein [Streptomyces samsunensis]MCQ8832011.1 helix-turn-helix domain-containing protein [Streptomyces samsunensis]
MSDDHAAALPGHAVEAVLTALAREDDAATLDALLAGHDLRQLSPAAQQAVRTIGHTLAEARSRQALLNAIYETALEITAKRDREAAIRTIVRSARTLVGSDMAYLSLNDYETEETYIHTTDGVVTSAYRSLRMPFGTGVLGAVADSDVPAATRDYLADETLHHIPSVDETVRAEGVHAILGAPLHVEGRVIGALLVADRYTRAYEHAEASTLASLASLAAVAIETAQLVESLNHSLDQARHAEAESRRHVTDLQRLARADASLVSALSSMEGLSRIESELATILGTDVHMVTADALRAGSTVSGHDARRLSELAEESRRSGGPVTGNTRPADRPEHSTAETGPTTVMAAAVGDKVLGAICTTGPVHALDRLILQRAATTLIAQLLFDQAIAEAGTREQSELLDLMLAETMTAPSTPTLRRKLAEYGITDDASLAVLVVDSPGPETAHAVVARVVQESADGAGLVASHRGHVCALLISEAPLRLGAEISTELERRNVAATVGCAGPGRGITSVRETHERAHRLARALRVLGREGEAATESTLGSVGLVLGAQDTTLHQAIVQDVIGPALAYDTQHSTSMAPTALAYLDANRSVAATAARLHLHQNTVRQRLDKLDRLLGADWRDGTRVLDVHLALRLWQLSQL